MPRHDGSRDLWNNSERATPRQFDPGMGVSTDRPRSRSGDRNWLLTILKLGLLVAACMAAWRFGKPYVQRFRSSTDVEQCAIYALRHLPPAVKSEQELRDAVAREAGEALSSHPSALARWYVCFGPRGDAVRVLRDDAFSTSERAFAERIVDEGRLRLDTAGVRHDVFLYPLGASYSTVMVDGIPWCVVVGWSEKK